MIEDFFNTSVTFNHKLRITRPRDYTLFGYRFAFTFQWIDEGPQGRQSFYYFEKDKEDGHWAMYDSSGWVLLPNQEESDKFLDNLMVNMEDYERVLELRELAIEREERSKRRKSLTFEI